MITLCVHPQLNYQAQTHHIYVLSRLFMSKFIVNYFINCYAFDNLIFNYIFRIKNPNRERITTDIRLKTLSYRIICINKEERFKVLRFHYQDMPFQHKQHQSCIHLCLIYSCNPSLTLQHTEAGCSSIRIERFQLFNYEKSSLGTASYCKLHWLLCYQLIRLDDLLKQFHELIGHICTKQSQMIWL